MRTRVGFMGSGGKGSVFLKSNYRKKGERNKRRAKKQASLKNNLLREIIHQRSVGDDYGYDEY